MGHKQLCNNKLNEIKNSSKDKTTKTDLEEMENLIRSIMSKEMHLVRCI